MFPGGYPDPLWLDDIQEIPCPHCGKELERSEWEALFKTKKDFVICPQCGKRIKKADLENR